MFIWLRAGCGFSSLEGGRRVIQGEDEPQSLVFGSSGNFGSTQSPSLHPFLPKSTESSHFLPRALPQTSHRGVSRVTLTCPDTLRTPTSGSLRPLFLLLRSHFLAATPGPPLSRPTLTRVPAATPHCDSEAHLRPGGLHAKVSFCKPPPLIPRAVAHTWSRQPSILAPTSRGTSAAERGTLTTPDVHACTCPHRPQDPNSSLGPQGLIRLRTYQTVAEGRMDATLQYYSYLPNDVFKPGPLPVRCLEDSQGLTANPGRGQGTRTKFWGLDGQWIYEELWRRARSNDRDATCTSWRPRGARRRAAEKPHHCRFWDRPVALSQMGGQ